MSIVSPGNVIQYDFMNKFSKYFCIVDERILSPFFATYNMIF